MRLGVFVLALTVSSCGGCAGRRVTAPDQPQIYRFTFAEQLPGESTVCVHRTPWDASLVCITLDELRQNIRGIRRASLE